MQSLARSLTLGLVLTLAACTDGHGTGHPSAFDQAGIVGGQPDNESRSVIGIVTRGGGLCSGSLILPNLILTAHHCVASISGGDAVVCGSSRFGSPRPAADFAVSWDQNLTDGAPDESIFDVVAVRVPDDKDVCGNDVALLQLSSNVPDDQATPIEPRIETAPRVDELFDAVGYGLTNPNDQAGTTAGKRMRFDGVRVGCLGMQCSRALGTTETEWAAEAPVCSGDSGGPALDSEGRVIGVTSRGPAECSFAVYSGVSPWKTFILDAANDAVEDGGYDPPDWVTGMPATDGGTPIPDAGTPMTDAGMPADAGSPLPDGGVPSDAGMPMSDAGVPGDAGTPMLDGGPSNDAGTPIDAGTPNDAGTPIDAGAPVRDAGAGLSDAGMPVRDAGVTDAGSTNDPGSRNEQHDGNLPVEDSGCGCRTAPGGRRSEFGWGTLVLAAVLAAARRRRR